MSSVKVSGYLEKKGKLRLGSPWKRYWFVLEGRLLLYYRSKDEYEAISPCKGSINLCPPCSIKPTPASSCVFQIQCRASTVTLRSDNRTEEDKWLEALLTATTQSKGGSPNRMSYFRYSLDDLPSPVQHRRLTMENDEERLQRQNTLPELIARLPIVAAPIRQLMTTMPGKTSKDVTFTSGDDGLYASVQKQKRRSAPVAAFGDVPALQRNFSRSSDALYEKIKSARASDESLVETLEGIDCSGVEEKNCFKDIDHNENNISKEYTHHLEEVKPVKNNKEGKPKRGKFQMLAQFIRQEKNQEKMHSKARSTSFIKRMLKKRNKSVKSEQDVLYETINDDTVIEDKKTDEMLNELQQILETRKSIFQRKLQENISKNYDNQSQSSDVPSIPSLENEENPTKSEETERPELPPKTIAPPNPKTIDEILEDLDKENSKQNVKKLIDKFNTEGNEVILRKKGGVFKSSSDSKVMEHLHNPNNRNSDLGQLLDELSKVTCAPILPPGATCSLITTCLTDDEWLQLNPIRQRRFSEPDYDVPRPHRSLQFHAVAKNDEGRIPATHFFGPPASPKLSSRSDSPYSAISTMDPDSLELDTIPTITKPKQMPLESAIEQEHTLSYTSHNYLKFNQIYGNCLEKNSLIDSLEPLTELSTVF